jgi:hypothetical protein
MAQKRGIVKSQQRATNKASIGQVSLPSAFGKCPVSELSVSSFATLDASCICHTLQFVNYNEMIAAA